MGTALSYNNIYIIGKLLFPPSFSINLLTVIDPLSDVVASLKKNSSFRSRGFFLDESCGTRWEQYFHIIIIYIIGKLLFPPSLSINLSTVIAPLSNNGASFRK